MSEIRKANTDHPYFVTLTVLGWIDIFTRSLYSEVIIDCLKFCQANKKLEIHAYVIMTNHIHLILRHPDGKLADVLRDFKSFSARSILDQIKVEPTESRREWLMHMFKYYAKFQKQNTHHQFWQKTSFPVLLNTSGKYDQKMNYIHMNPYKAGYVTDPCSWTYSSANPKSPLKTLYCQSLCS